jgi:cephalosporin-C deacetylase-like acetyl esterase
MRTVSDTGPHWLSSDLPTVPTVKSLVDSLVNLGARQAAADRRVRDALTSVDAFVEYRDRVRRNFWAALGGEPERTPLRPRLVGAIDRESYRIEKIIFESRPRFFVTGLLYMPTRSPPPYPAVLRPLGHFPHGKATYVRGGDEVQGHCVALAWKGYLVFTFDPYGQIERGSYFDPLSGNNHFSQGTQGLLTGRHLGQHYIWDSIRALDYLLSRPEVDPGRVCLTGTSGGGSQTVYHAAVDERVGVSVPVCYVMESHRQIGALALHPESVFPGYVEPNGPNNTALVACVAPRPQLIIGAVHDSEFPAESTRAVYDDVREVYRLLGAEDRVALVLTDSPHGYTLPMRRAMYRWVNHWLRVDADDRESGVVQDSPEALLCTTVGDVAELKGETVFSLNQAWATRLAADRSARRAEAPSNPAAYRDAIRAGLTKTLFLRPPDSPLNATAIVCEETSIDWTEAIRLEPEAGFEILVHVSVPKKARPLCPVVIHCNDEWNLPRPHLLAALLRAGFAVVTVDTRLGAAYTALTFGRTGVGMAVIDLTRALDLVAERPNLDLERVAIYGDGPKSGLVALVVAFLDQRVKAIATNDLQRSLSDLIEEPDRRSDLQLLPGALRYYDVVDLCAAVAPRPHFLNHPDPDIAWAKQFYAATGSAEALKTGWCSPREFYPRLVAWLETEMPRRPIC